MQTLAIALSAFSARATRGRRAILLGYSGLAMTALLGLAKLISMRAAEDGNTINTLALADMFSMMVVGAALFVVAPAMVASQVAEERRSGTLDLLRTAPLTPTALAGGFLVSAPGSMYLLCAAPLALHVFAGITGAIPLQVVAFSLFLVPLGAIAAMLVAMLLAVSVGKEGGGAAPLIVAGLLACGTMITVGMASSPEAMPFAYVHPAGALAALYQSFDGPFRDAFSSPWRLEQMNEARIAAMMAIEPVLAITVYFGACVLLLSAARRVLAGEVRSRLTKPTAVGLFSLCAFALLFPMRGMTDVHHLDHGDIGAIAFVLVLPFIACVLGATSTALGNRARRLSPDGAPHLAAALMIGVAATMLCFLYGTRVITILTEREGYTLTTVGLVMLAMTVPIYARWAATRISSNSGRLAFWALISVHLFLQVPSLFIVAHDRSGHDIQHLLSTIDLLFGLVLPLFLMRRQQLADRGALAAAAT